MSRGKEKRLTETWKLFQALKDEKAAGWPFDAEQEAEEKALYDRQEAMARARKEALEKTARARKEAMEARAAGKKLYRGGKNPQRNWLFACGEDCQNCPLPAGPGECPHTDEDEDMTEGEYKRAQSQGQGTVEASA